MSLKEKLLDLFFPPRCAFCRRTGVHGVCATLARAVTEKEKDGARRGTPV